MLYKKHPAQEGILFGRVFFIKAMLNPAFRYKIRILRSANIIYGPH